MEKIRPNEKLWFGEYVRYLFRVNGSPRTYQIDEGEGVWYLYYAKKFVYAV